MLAKGAGEPRLAVEPPPTARMAGGESDEIEKESSVLWNSFLKQAQANSEASRAILAQARANEESSRAIHLLAQRMPSLDAIEVVPDRLES